MTTVPHRWNFYTIAAAFVHSILQHARLTVPDWIIQPQPESPTPSSEIWSFYSDWYVWVWNLDDEYRPNAAWLQVWDWVHRQALRDWLREGWEWFKDVAVAEIKGWTISAWGIADYLDSWIVRLWGRIRNAAWTWATSIKQAIDLLYGWFPGDVVSGAVSFYDKFVAWYEAGKSWARARYDDAMAAAMNAWNWIADHGIGIKEWWERVRDFVSDFVVYHEQRIKIWLGAAWDFLLAFKQNPYGSIASWLGSTWDRLYLFSGHALTFWYNLWGMSAELIGAFFADPLGWAYEHAEDYVLDHIW